MIIFAGMGLLVAGPIHRTAGSIWAEGGVGLPLRLARYRSIAAVTLIDKRLRS